MAIRSTRSAAKGADTLLADADPELDTDVEFAVRVAGRVLRAAPLRRVSTCKR